jgi:hypothetical protein
MKRAAAVLTALALSGSLAACGGDDGADDLAPSAATGTPSASPVPGLSPTTAPTAGPTRPAPTASATPAQDGDAPALPGRAGAVGAGAVRRTPDGHRRAGRAQDGYDRVVFELAARLPGRLAGGWSTSTSPAPRAPATPVEVAGDAALVGADHRHRLPDGHGQEEVSSDPALPGDLQVVEDVVLGAVFEGQYEAFIGTAGRQPFRVFRLGDPERVVVDVRTP